MVSKVKEATVYLDSMEETLPLLGKFDAHLNIIEDNFDVRVIPRGNELIIQGKEGEVAKVSLLFKELLEVIRQGNRLTEPEFMYALQMVKKGMGEKIGDLFNEVLLVTERGKQIKPKTIGQKYYLAAMKSNDIVFGIGPAGTGKTYLAMAMAVYSLKNKLVQRLILTRPAVEAGEHLGFLPGDLQEKVDPYLRPLYDALYDLLGMDTFQKYVERRIIEVAPLAYMRGRTLDDSFVILDEAQNTTSEQMKMFLTRLGFGSKAVITGDVTQVDLPRGKYSGLSEATEILQGIPGISFYYLTESDVVRHPLVQKVIRAYEKHQEKAQNLQSLDRRG